jgi:hypothetical protein
MHPAAWHQPSKDAEGFRALHAAENHIEIAMSENDASAMQHTGIRELGGIHRAETELLYDPRVVLRLLGRPRVYAFAFRHVPWPAMPSIKASPFKPAKRPTVRPKYTVTYESPWHRYTALGPGSWAPTLRAGWLTEDMMCMCTTCSRITAL